MPLKLSVRPAAEVLLTAYEQHLTEIRAQPPERVKRRITVDVPSAVSVVLGAQSALLKFRGAFESKLPEFPLRYIDELDSFAYACLHAHMQSLAVSGSEDRIAALMGVATPLRRTLVADAKTAVGRGLLDADSYKEIPTGQGRLDTARALLALTVLFRSGWDAVKNRTAVTEAELDTAARTAIDLLAALGRDDNAAASDTTSDTDDMRLRAYTLFFNVYDECRRGMHYLRWHENDARRFTPPLTGSRTGRARKGDEEEPDGEDEGSGGGAAPT